MCVTGEPYVTERLIPPSYYILIPVAATRFLLVAHSSAVLFIPRFIKRSFPFYTLLRIIRIEKKKLREQREKPTIYFISHTNAEQVPRLSLLIPNHFRVSLRQQEFVKMMMAK